MSQELKVELEGVSREAIGGVIEQEELESVGAPPARVGFWVFIAGEVIILLSLIASAIYFRLTYPHWHETSTFTNVVISTINTFILLTGSLMAVLAHHFAFADAWKKARRYLLLTMLCGLAFVGMKAYEYSLEIHHGFYPNTDPFWMFYYTITGIHGLHVFAGACILFGVWLYVRKTKSKYAVENAALYWHFVDLVWLYIFPMFYLT